MNPVYLSGKMVTEHLTQRAARALEETVLTQGHSTKTLLSTATFKELIP